MKKTRKRSRIKLARAAIDHESRSMKRPEIFTIRLGGQRPVKYKHPETLTAFARKAVNPEHKD